MKKILLMFFTVCVTAWGGLQAQDRPISGRVTSAEDNSGLPGVNVLVKGTTNGTVTDVNGGYTISASATSTLVFSFIGLQTQEVSVGERSIIDVQLKQDVQQLSEVVVTALGIKRDQKSLSYAAQQVNAEDKLRVTRDTDLNATLAGKVAGVQILSQAGSKLGAGANVRIRGAASLTDKNPLYIIDGTPVSQTEIDRVNTQSGAGISNTTTVDLGINMDDVESISILKGPSATAIYGQRGDAGVIVITTKKGKKQKGVGIDFNSTTTFEKVNVLPKYQNSYAGGGESDWRTFTWSPGNPEEWKVFDGKKYHDYSDDASWGPKIDGTEYIPWYAWYPGNPYSFKTTPITPQKNNVRDYYETGKSYNNNISFNKVSENYSVRVSYTNLKRTGIIPNTSLDRNYISTQNSFQLGKNITIGSNLNYTSESVFGDFNDGYSNFTGSGSFQQWFHRDIDINILKELRDFTTPTGALASWNHLNPTATTNFNTLNFNRGNYWYNFYSYTDRISNTNNRDRLFGDINLSYKINDNLTVQGFVRRNQLTSNYENKTPTLLETSGRQTGLKAGFQTGQTYSLEENYEFLGLYAKEFGDFDLSVNVGGNIRKNTYRDVHLQTNGGLVVPDLFTVANSKGTLNYYNYRQTKEVKSLYGRGSLGYKDLAFLEFSARNDWSSTLPSNANSYFYPSVGGSFVFSELLDGSIPFLSFGKLRGSWAQVGSDLDPYQLDLTYATDQAQYNGTNLLMTAPNVLPNSDIKPALSSAYEGGIDMKFFHNRAGVSFTYYRENKINEILSVDVTAVSGYFQKIINAGRVERNGIELQLEGTPVKNSAFEWNVTFNLARNVSRVIELAEGVNSINATTPGFAVRDRFGSVQLVHKTNYDGGSNRWGQLRGIGIKRINGQPVLNDDGTYQFESDVFFGSVLPDFTGGLFNTFSYKDFSLSLAIDFQKGGKYFSLSNFYGEYSGLLENTAATNDKGQNVRDDVSEGGGVHVFGVDGSGKPVDRYVHAYNYFHQFGDNSIIDNSVFDASFTKLREVSLGYRVPLKNTKVIQNLSVSVVARNAWVIYLANKNFDSSELSQRFGENGQQPGIRSIGFNIKAGF